MEINRKCNVLLCLAVMLSLPLVPGISMAQTPQHMVFVSDPQYPWTDLTDLDISDPNKEARSKELIGLQYSDIASFRKLNGGASRIPVMINGDITAYGHGGERSYMKSVLDDKLEGLYDYGLGNHDYANNVNDCFLNNCAAGSLNDFKDRYWGKVESMDLAAKGQGFGKAYYGSLAYSKSFGEVHMVQLNNEPTYSVRFSSGNPFAPTDFEISPALDWLEQDLKSARERGKIIILNLHKASEWDGSDDQQSRFQRMIEQYKVTAIFGGHDHWKAGRYFDWNMDQRFGTVPVFLSGSASQQTYLIASFSRDRQSLTVSIVQRSNWPSREVAEVIPVLR